MCIRKSDSAFRRLRQPLLWLLCLSLAVWAAPAWATTAQSIMRIQAPSLGQGEYGYSYGATASVLVGEPVTLRPENSSGSQGFTWTKDGASLPGTDGESSIVVSSDAVGEATYKCTYALSTMSGEVLVTLNFTNPTTLVLNKTAGPASLVPGASFDYTATCTPPAAYEGSEVNYDWKVEDSKGQEIQPGNIYTLPSGGKTATLTLADGPDAWMLNGAQVVCTASLVDNPSLTATASDDLTVGIKVEPAESEADTPVTAVLQGTQFVADLKLTSVTGGNVPADQLEYQWQWQNQGSTPGTWTKIGGTQGKTLAISVPMSTWTDRAYRCVVSGDVESATSGIFDVTSGDVSLVLSDDVNLNPTSAVVVNSGTIEATGTILVPANRIDSPDKTVYGHAIEVLSDDASWQVLPGTFKTEPAKAMKAKDTLQVLFTPLEGTYQYRMMASSDAGENVKGYSGPFRASLVNTSDTKAWGTSDPASDDQGNIVVDAGKAITYTVNTQGGTGNWSIRWSDPDGQTVGFGGKTYTDNAPALGRAISATATVLDYRNKLVTGVNPIAVKFGTPFVTLAWSPAPPDEKIIDYAEISGDRSVDVLTLSATGGIGTYRFAYAVSDQEPTEDSGWTPMENATFTVTESMLKHDFSDRKTAHIPVWFQAKSGEQAIPTFMDLIVAQDPAVLIGNNGGNLQYADDAYTVTYNQNYVPTLSASLINSSCDTPTFHWDLPGVTSGDGDTWTPPTYLEAPDASAPPYVVEVQALSGDETILATTVNLDIQPMLSADAGFSEPSVLPYQESTLTLNATEQGSGNLTFSAGPEGGSMRTLSATSATSAGLNVHGLSIPGVYTYLWSVTDEKTKTTIAEQTDLTTLYVDGVKYLIRPEWGADLVTGSSFDMVLNNIGTPAVGPGDVTWSSSNEGVATVDGNGHVSLLTPGAVKIAATLTDSDDIAATSNFTVQDASVTEDIVVPTLTFAPGATVNAQFKATPAGASLTAENLPEGLQLSTTGYLTGTAPQDSGDYDFTVTASWPNTDTKTVDATLHVTSGGGGDDGGSGGCNGGFGILALALLAIPALRRQRS